MACGCKQKTTPQVVEEQKPQVENTEVKTEETQNAEEPKKE